jgi:hypothetical protein
MRQPQLLTGPQHLNDDALTMNTADAATTTVMISDDNTDDKTPPAAVILGSGSLR